MLLVPALLGRSEPEPSSAATAEPSASAKLGELNGRESGGGLPGLKLRCSPGPRLCGTNDDAGRTEARGEDDWLSADVDVQLRRGPAALADFGVELLLSLGLLMGQVQLCGF